MAYGVPKIDSYKGKLRLSRNARYGGPFIRGFRSKTYQNWAPPSLFRPNLESFSPKKAEIDLRKARLASKTAQPASSPT